MTYVSSVSLDNAEIKVQKGTVAFLEATVLPENANNKALSWQSSDESVATVENGCISALKVGKTRITAKAKDGSSKSDSCCVEVTNEIMVNHIYLDTSFLNMVVGEDKYIGSYVYPENAKNTSLKWKSSKTSVATVNPDSGKITAVKAGVAIITATAADGSGVKDKCEVTVSNPIKVKSIELSDSKLTLKCGESECLCATVKPSNATNKAVKWSSSNAKVAIVNSKGRVTARLAGKAVITAKSKDGSDVKGVCTVTVKPSRVPILSSVQNKASKNYFEDPIDVNTGSHIMKNTILTLFGGQNLKFVIEYDSGKLSSGSFGTAWFHNYEKRLEVANSKYRVYSNPSVYSDYSMNDCGNVYTCESPGKNGYVLRVNSESEYPYYINCNYEYTEYYDTNGRLAKVVSHEGFETLITYSDTLTTITDMVSGKKIYLQKDSSGKIVRVYDDVSRQATFIYNQDFLTYICDLNGNTLAYTYNELGQVLTGTDAEGNCYFTNTYDECGRVVSQKDGVENSLVSTLCYGDLTTVATNRNGKESVREYDCDGLLIKYTDENGNVTKYTYDERYNIVEEIDAKNNSVTKTYGPFNKPVSITDKNGNTTSFEYDDYGNVTKILYPAVNGVRGEETFVYNSRNQLIRHTDLRGTVTVYTYDASGMPETKKVGTKNAIRYSYENGFLKSQTDAMGYTTQYGYNAIGQMTSMTDADNKVTRYEYDNCGNLLKTIDANGKTVENVYDGNHQKIWTKDANGNTTEYLYNGNMKNEVITLPNNNTIRYEFDGEDRPVKMTDQSGNVTRTVYDDAGRVVEKFFADSSRIKYEYDAVGNVIKETNQKDAVTFKTYDANGNVLSIKDNDGNITRYQYNAMGKKVRAVNAVSGAVIYEYSKAGDLLSETDALGNKKCYTYDEFGNMLTATDAKGNTTTYTYDANNNMLTSRNALGNTTTYTYDSLNRLVSVKDAKNHTVTYGYDPLGRCTTITDAKQRVFTTTYDGNGNVLKTIDAKGNTVSDTVYNCLNLPEVVTDSTGKTTTYTYTPLGKVWTAVDSMNHRQEYSYNSRGLNTAVLDANNCTSHAEYDVLGNITKLTGPMGSIINYTYDQMGRLIAETTSSGGSITYGYNALNVKEQLTNARGQVRKYFYDAAGRIIGFVGEEDSVSYTYDQNGNVLTVADSKGVIRREYDALNRVTKCADTFGKVICYEYDAVGNLKHLVYPDNTLVTYDYDENNNLKTVTDWANRVTTYTYDENNRVTGVVKPDGSITTTVYDNKQRIDSTVEKTATGQVITGFEYTYDNLSRIVEEKHLAENIKMCYTYDSLNRVTKRQVISLDCGCVISEENYTYDAAGNITVAPDNTLIYDSNNRLVSFNGNTVSYDMDGNMLSNVETVFSYDSANRLITACDHTYTYNAEDVRIRNLCSDADTTYTYNTNCKLSQLLTKTTNGVTTKYVYGNGLIGEEESQEFKVYHFDFRGSAVAITDEDGNIIDTFKYDTYGNLTEHIGNSEVIFGYNGRDGVVTDKNGLIYMRARYYSPAMRRFVNADILHGEISDSTSLNRYSYVNGNPVSFVDPFGLEASRDGNTTSFWYLFKNSDGTYSLHDNRRGNPDSVFHEQILSISPSGPSWDLKEGNIGIGSIGIDFINGGWEWEYLDLSLLDIGHAEVGAELKNGDFYVGAFVSAYSPSVSFEFLGIKVEIGAEVGSIGGELNVGTGGFTARAAYGWGASLNIEW